jgi:hypothetical protein
MYKIGTNWQIGIIIILFGTFVPPHHQFGIIKLFFTPWQQSCFSGTHHLFNGPKKRVKKPKRETTA